jgi:hypothetical protein
MKKLLLSMSAFSLTFAASLAVPAPASADPGKGRAAEYAEFCKFFITIDPITNVGECLSGSRSDHFSAFPAHYCNLLDNADLLEFYGYRNLGECIDDIKDVPHP